MFASACRDTRDKDVKLPLVLLVVKMGACVLPVMSVNVQWNIWANNANTLCVDLRVLMAETVFDQMSACVLLPGKEIAARCQYAISLV